MDLRFNGKNGISARLITEKIKKEVSRGKNEDKRKIRNSFKSGKLSAKDMKNIAFGMEMLGRIVNESFNVQYNELLQGEKDVGRIKKDIIEYRHVMEDFLRRIRVGAREEYFVRKRIELLPDYTQISQAARDGIILKKDTRQEIIDGEIKEITYDTTMTPKEVIDILYQYEKTLERLQFERLNNYIGLGLGFAGTLGIMTNGCKNKTNKKDKGTLITLGSTAIGGLKLLQGVIEKDQNQEIWDIEDEQYRLRTDLLVKEQISSKAEEDAIKNIKTLSEKQRKLENRRDNKELLFETSIDIAAALLSGLYISRNIRLKENGEIDGKSLAAALVSLNSMKNVSGNFVRSIKGFQDIRNFEIEYEELSKKVQEIISQMEEKVYPLKGAKKAFNSVKIENFNGKFYPKKNYETGEIEFGTKINVPEFSMKRGDIVLLSGESGAGKSTFLRLLKRGDINNRKCIKLDNNQEVDNLGNEYISFRPSIDLGDEKNVLYQITGKQSISDLDEKERKNLLKIMEELNLNFPNLLEQLASKKFMEFSTGQQRRLALSKLFYRIDDGTSVIIVDEPVGNVEDKLIREQLEMIKKYAVEKNVMLLLTTHRLDLAEDLATKRYHINKDGVLEKMPIIDKNKERDE